MISFPKIKRWAKIFIKDGDDRKSYLNSTIKKNYIVS